MKNIDMIVPSRTKLIAAAIITVFALIVISNSWYTVDEKERGVVLRYGKFVGEAEPGLNFLIPFVETVKRISTQNHSEQYPSLQAYSKDQQSAKVKVSVSWHVMPGDVAAVYKSYGDLTNLVTRLISRQVPTQVENVFGRYTAIEAVQNRGQFVIDITSAIKAGVNGPVVIDGVQVENIDFSAAYEHSIEERMKAEVQVKTREQMLATEKVQAAIRVTQAQAEADSQVAQAKAEAESTRLRGDAEADAIKARAQALASNQNLVELTKAERWDGKLPTTMVPNGTTPFMDIGKNSER